MPNGCRPVQMDFEPPRHATGLGTRLAHTCSRANGSGPSSLKWLGPPTFDVALIEVQATDEIPTNGGGRIAPGPAYVSRSVKGHPWGGASSELHFIATPSGGELVLMALACGVVRQQQRVPLVVNASARFCRPLLEPAAHSRIKFSNRARHCPGHTRTQRPGSSVPSPNPLRTALLF